VPGGPEDFDEVAGVAGVDAFVGVAGAGEDGFDVVDQEAGGGAERVGDGGVEGGAERGALVVGGQRCIGGDALVGVDESRGVGPGQVVVIAKLGDFGDPVHGIYTAEHGCGAGFAGEGRVGGGWVIDVGHDSPLVRCSPARAMSGRG
jgi:hypothetical protein